MISSEVKSAIRDLVRSKLMEEASLDSIHRAYTEVREQFDDLSTEEISGIVAWKLTPEGKLVLETDECAVARYHDFSQMTAPTLSEPENSNGSQDALPYDNPAKTGIRIKYREFIAKHFRPSELQNARALCLCAADWLDVRDVFDPLGIPRENVWGAENDARLLQISAANGQELGVNFWPRDLNLLFSSKPELKFDIAIIDVKGQLSLRLLQLIQSLPISRKACVIVNCMRRRENSFMQQYAKSLLHIKTFHELIHDDKDYETAIESTEYEHLRELVNDEIRLADVMMKGGLEQVLFSSIHHNRTDEWNLQQLAKRLAELYNQKLEHPTSLEDALEKALVSVNRLTYKELHQMAQGRKDIEEMPFLLEKCFESLSSFTLEYVLNKPTVIASAQQSYNNPATGTPYISQLEYLEQTKKPDEYRDVALFFLSVALDLIERTDDIQELETEKQKLFSIKNYGSDNFKNLRDSLVYEGREKTYKLFFSKLIKALSFHMKQSEKSIIATCSPRIRED